MREISPSVNVSAQGYFEGLPPELKKIVQEIRRQKSAGLRIYPSATLIDFSCLLTKIQRERLVDAVAALVDENLFGRSEMCQQFAELLHLALSHLTILPRLVFGYAIYFSPDGRELHRWQHAWVRVGDEVIDANVDSLFENPMVPKTVRVAPFWGPIKQIPPGRRLREDHNMRRELDQDVATIWWPELKKTLGRFRLDQ